MKQNETKRKPEQLIPAKGILHNKQRRKEGQLETIMQHYNFVCSFSSSLSVRPASQARITILFFLSREELLQRGGAVYGKVDFAFPQSLLLYCICTRCTQMSRIAFAYQPAMPALHGYGFVTHFTGARCAQVQFLHDVRSIFSYFSFP